MSIVRIGADELAEVLGTPGWSSRVAIIDVRDEDFEGGCIPGAVNVPSESFDDRVVSLVDELRNHDMVVFHCMLSQVRGPSCAARFATQLKKVEGHSVEVRVLANGFKGWSRRFGDTRPDLIQY